MADIHLANSGYQTGSIDTATTLVDGADAVKAQHQNGPASAIVQIETILGVGTTLKGSVADLVTRLAVEHNADGTQKTLIVARGGTGATTLTVDGVLLGNGTSAVQVTVAATAARQGFRRNATNTAYEWVAPTPSGDAVGTGRSISTSTGLSGGGDLSADRTLLLANTAVGAGTYGGVTTDPDRSVKLTVDAQGRLTAASQGNTLTAVLDRNSADVNVPDGTETSIYSFSVPGGNLSTDRMLRCTIHYTDAFLDDPNSIIVRLKYGATTIASVTVPSGGAGSGASHHGRIIAYLYADGATSAQRGFLDVLDFFSTGGGPGGLGSSYISHGSASEDSTAAKTFDVTIDMGSVVDNFDKRHAVLERI